MKNFATAIMLAIGANAEWDWDSRPFSSGEVHTKENFMYGRFVAMMKPSQAKGSRSSFALYALDYSDNNDEIMNESNGFLYNPPSDPTDPTVMTLMHHHTGWGVEFHEDIDRESYHKFEIEWTPEYMTFSIDDEEIRHLEGEGIEALTEPQNLVLSIYSIGGDERYEKLKNANLPTYTEIPYVEVYDYDQEKDEFNLRFRDDFNTVDSQRWGQDDMKTWHWLSSTFEPYHSCAAEGKLFLKLDQKADDDSDDFHVLPAPKSGTLDSAIEKATRVLVTMARVQLDNFSQSMSQYLMH